MPRLSHLLGGIQVRHAGTPGSGRVFVGFVVHAIPPAGEMAEAFMSRSTPHFYSRPRNRAKQQSASGGP
ncbi:MAG: hypothetical protein DLM68_03155 [Hyphomicrobiales bacterium]|nr:MAG: hypothetical protein DLM68_03155 [Hyphomicrobiales bacterium]